MAEEGRNTPSGRTILIVDDEPAVRGLAARILRDAGHVVIEAGSGDEALAAAADVDVIDLLLTDVLMRGMSGIDLAQRMKSERADLRVLYMSGYPPRQVGIDPVRTDADFLEKPFAPVELSQLVSRILRR